MLLKELDYGIFRAIHTDFRSPSLDPIFHAITTSGLGEVQLALALPLLLKQNLRPLYMLLMIAVLPCGLTAQLVKRLVPRDRPSGLYDAIPMEKWLYNSFPSGHTTTSFAIATMIWLFFRDTKYAWLAIPAYFWASFVGLSRIYVGVHWPTDVIGGACLGISTAILFYMWANKIFSTKGTPLVYRSSVAFSDAQ